MSIKSLSRLAAVSLTAIIGLQGGAAPEGRLFDAQRLTAHIDPSKSVACHVGSAMLLFEKNGVELFAPPEDLRVAEKVGTKGAIWEIYGDNCIVQLDVKILTPQGIDRVMDATPFKFQD